MDSCFISFKKSISGIELPQKFTFPFDYIPHELARIAATELQEYITSQTEWEHDFETEIGKMFGVLVVKNTENKLGYLAAFSGILAGKTILSHFIPPVYDRKKEDSFYTGLEEELNQITQKIQDLQNSEEFLKAVNLHLQNELVAQKALSDAREELKAKKKIRKEKRTATLSPEMLELLRKESMDLDFAYKRLAKKWNLKLVKSQQIADTFQHQLDELITVRKVKSAAMQKSLFTKYDLLNREGVKKNVVSIFDLLERQPPAGTGDCAAPKLLQYAFTHNYTPIALAEFWWGKSPKLEVRKHAHFYPACKTKCEPILGHMLKGLELDKNPVLDVDFEKLLIETIYEDEDILVINKPVGLLSVPGKRLKDSVETRLKEKYPNATGPMLAHRLDMGTSGLMVISKSLEIHRLLQSQFTKRTVKKRYVALLDGVVESDKGTIDLPLRVDIDNRPSQIVDFQYGKKAITNYEVMERKDNKTRIYFYPITGRTHQLRVHASHPNGLNTPILGDEIYGIRANRLHLQANKIVFMHPVKKTLLSFILDPEF